MLTIKNILIPTDFSEQAASALAYGRDLARQYGASLHLLFVHDDVVARYAMYGAPMWMEDVDRAQDAAKEALDKLLTAEDRHQLHAQSCMTITMDSPAHVIVNYAKTHNVDLIVMGTHGRGGVSHVLLGSVAERVVRTAPCPVLTVRHPERECLAPDALVTVARA